MVGGGKALDESALAGVEEADAIFPQRGCCFFWVPTFSGGDRATPPTAGGSGGWERISAGVGGRPAADPWWRRALMKVREWSEVVAGPRWKTLIRRFNRSAPWCGGARQAKFQYDPLSYALNFEDDGASREEFSSRFTMPNSHGGPCATTHFT
ncbi:uncharacterized protein LOC144709828 [Wolffia australiana]